MAASRTTADGATSYKRKRYTACGQRAAAVVAGRSNDAGAGFRGVECRRKQCRTGGVPGGSLQPSRGHRREVRNTPAAESKKASERKLLTFLMSLARPERFELPTPKFVAWCSIQLSYGRVEQAIMEMVENLVKRFCAT